MAQNSSVLLDAKQDKETTTKKSGPSSTMSTDTKNLNKYLQTQLNKMLESSFAIIQGSRDAST